MSYIFYNPNPKNRFVRDCAVRALCKITGESWIDIYRSLCYIGEQLSTMPDASDVFDRYVGSIGYIRTNLPNICPDCLTVRNFCQKFNRGSFICCTGDHVVAVMNGNYYDACDSGNEIVLYFYERKY